MAADYRPWWRKQVSRDQVRAFAVSRKQPHPAPPKVKHLFSAGRLDGTKARYYAFATNADRDRFVEDNPACEVCADPLGENV